MLLLQRRRFGVPVRVAANTPRVAVPSSGSAARSSTRRREPTWTARRLRRPAAAAMDVPLIVRVEPLSQVDAMRTPSE